MNNITEIDLLTFDIPSRIIALEKSADEMWMVIAGSEVLLMQLGFAFLEGGCVRYKNLQSIMVKVFTNTAICILMMWLVGYAFMFGKNDSSGFIGTSLFAADGFDEDTHHYSHFVFQTAVAAAANSIVSGGAAERMTFVGYMVLSVFFSGWIYPVVIHWAYAGWLYDMGYHDFAGSGVIHTTGAVGALVTTYMLKPRKNRFNAENASEFEPCNITYIVLSTLSLYFCWMFFNAGSTFSMTGDNIWVLGTAGMNTMLSGASGGLTVFLLHYFMSSSADSRYSLVMICNGNLAGLVAVTGSCDNIEAWAAVLVGFCGGFVYVMAQRLIHHLKIDDPVDAVPIHGGCGIFGALVPGFLDRDMGVIYGFGGRQIGVQALGILVFCVWSFGFHYIVLSLIRRMRILRIDELTEEIGMDKSLCGGPGFFYKPVDSIFQSHEDIHLQTQNDRGDHGNQIEIVDNILNHHN